MAHIEEKNNVFIEPDASKGLFKPWIVAGTASFVLGKGVSFTARVIFKTRLNPFDVGSTVFLLLTRNLVYVTAEKVFFLVFGPSSVLDLPEDAPHSNLHLMRQKVWTVINLSSKTADAVDRSVDQLFSSLFGIRTKPEVEIDGKIAPSKRPRMSEVFRRAFLDAVKQSSPSFIYLKVAVVVCGAPFLLPFVIHPFTMIIFIFNATVYNAHTIYVKEIAVWNGIKIKDVTTETDEEVAEIEEESA